ncbi:glycoside hydrolase family 61 protein [Colletotrichum tofieldiae]|uniref:lytic cellulose monooxygenase (C4-dehydrogenating) n=1 Tax=Colletotrichum tofieldiae TaxID=708197 RepID=A0A166YJM9_9PEZI|nr:glycoside hydrolase family 61 protein [Colletotrichum tofieldiae]GKT61803.1 glycoside hydrolase family 61 protein [Colletotrichum tofieldiae]GKT70142.1 glycoside hydrolase family 61 protein [Colletotrichum tofieldiae]GKT93184.1 glycoside hydrolase family 61 protein [Colletotrichum tofieldiae]
MVYLSKADGSSAFFKITEYGYTPEDKVRGTDVLSENYGKFEVTVPAGLAPGDYLLRAEAIVLHAASQPIGAQFYMTCCVSDCDPSRLLSLRLVRAAFLTDVDAASKSGSRAEAARRRSGSSFLAPPARRNPGIQVDVWGDGFSQYIIPGPAVASAQWVEG